MADIFISYSRKDSEQALALVEKLRADGFTVWMDQSGISGAEKWSAEIVDAIEAAQAIILLISDNSNASVNVHREISIASEIGKPILPVELETITLSRELRYPLAGLQRLVISDEEAITQSLAKLGVHRFAKAATEPIPASKKDTRKALMVLPFEDQSPGLDNGWFADGLMSELIGALSKIRSLRLIDQKTSLSYKGSKTSIAEIARLLGVRYFLEGSVRKFGEQIKVMTQLLDIGSGEYLWSDSHRGEFKDIFDIQEQVAEKVVTGLKVQLTPKEAEQLHSVVTQNPEAYELYLRAIDLAQSDTAGKLRAQELFERVIDLDSNAVVAYVQLATTYMNLRDVLPNSLEESRRLIMTALRIDPLYPSVYSGLAMLHLRQNEPHQALAMAQKRLELEPESASAIGWVGYCYIGLDDWHSAVLHYEKALALEPASADYARHVTDIYFEAGEYKALADRAPALLSVLERRLERFPAESNTVMSRLMIQIATRPREEWLRDVEVLCRDWKAEPILMMWLLMILLRVDASLAKEQLRSALKAGTEFDMSISEVTGLPFGLGQLHDFKALLAEVTENTATNDNG